MLAAGLLETVELAQMPNVGSFLPVVGAGFLAAAVVGYFSIRWLLAYLMRHSMRVFAVYCALAGTAAIVFTLLNG
jgi:undecaprenyl-diphosphatase